MVLFKTTGLGDDALDLELAGPGIGDRGLGLSLDRRLTSRAEAEGVPVQPQTAPDDKQGGDQDDQGQPGPKRSKAPQDRSGTHGKAFRSSSKCGPSRKVGQSPPQMIAVS